MRYLKSITIALVVTSVLLIGIGYFLPRTFSIEKSIKIDSEEQDVRSFICNLGHWNQWTVWNSTSYPGMKISYGKNMIGTGAIATWAMDDEIMGNVQVLDCSPGAVKLKLTTEDNFVSEGIITIKKEGERIRLTWKMNGNDGNNLIGRYFILVNDDILAHDMEKSLENLKKICEKE